RGGAAGGDQHVARPTDAARVASRARALPALSPDRSRARARLHHARPALGRVMSVRLETRLRSLERPLPEPIVPRAIASVLTEALSDPRPFDPWRLDARDPDAVRAMLPLFERIRERYLRAEVEGLEHLGHRPALYVGNHNGGIMGPDLFCTLSLLWRALGPEAPLYAMAHDFAMRRITPLGRVLQRLGGLR